jgi:hypothetical protein
MRASAFRLAGLVAAGFVVVFAQPAHALTNVFFNPSVPATLVASNVNSRTVSSGGYLMTYSVDGYWSAYAGGPPTGRFFSVFWPNGLHAQAITAGPEVGRGASITLKRVDGQPFALCSFTGKLLANTAGAGGAFEITPQLEGEDAFDEPLMYDASGYAGMSFPHTPMLSGYDAYKIHLWVDWALVVLTVVDASPVVPATLHLSAAATNSVQLSWPADAVGYTLQQTPGLQPANWTAVTNVARLVGTNIQVTLPASGGSRCFRLRQG